MERIAIDMDDVMADAEGRFMEYAKERYNIDINPIDLHEKSWSQALNCSHNEILSWICEKLTLPALHVKQIT